MVFVLLLGMVGCGAPKYKVDYCGAKDLYKNAKDSYRAGQKVELVYMYVATDTDYRFYLDGEPVDWDYEDGNFVIRFVMPEHDVVLDYTAVNSMLPCE